MYKKINDKFLTIYDQARRQTMKSKLVKKVLAVMAMVTTTGMLLAGCGSTAEETTVPADEAQDVEQAAETETEETTEPEAEAETQEPAETFEAPYFTKGVYASYAAEAENPTRTYFYVFTDETYGYTQDGEAENTGVPFDVKQADGKAAFSFGGETALESELVISSVENGVVKGAFDDGIELIFEPVDGVDPETFSAENYVNGPENSVYRDANGWSVKYDATKFQLNQNGTEVSFVYMGESAGTNMITATYTVENKGEAAIKELGKTYGDDVEYSEGTFPGADDVTGYFATQQPKEGTSGSYMTAIGRDYMDGALIFVLDGHNSGDDEKDMEVSDQLAAIIDSLTFASDSDVTETEDADASVIEKNMLDFDPVIATLFADQYYAFADMDKNHDALLLAEKDAVFDNGDGTMAATEAKIFGIDKDGKIKEYGSVAGGTASPLACKDGQLFYGGHNYMNKVHIENDELITDEGEYFDEYEDATVVAFTKAQ